MATNAAINKMRQQLNNKLEEKFTAIEKIGEGAYGTVFRAREKKTQSLVALKKIKLNDPYEGGVPSSTLREIGLLKDLNHPNVLKLIDVFITKKHLFLVVENLDIDLKKLLSQHKKGLSHDLAKCYMYQLMLALSYCHSRRVLHRDLKMENLLVDKKGNIKLADFGLARCMGLPIRTYTHTVVTLWYRSPELLLKAEHYGPWVDMWSLGCIFAEMLTSRVLLPGDSEIDQIYRIFRTLGTPDDTIWPGFSQLPEYRNFPKFKPLGLESYIGNGNKAALDLLTKLLTYNTATRISAKTGLSHEYFNTKL